MTDACFGMSVRTFSDAERAGVGAFPDAERAGLSECPLGGAAILKNGIFSCPTKIVSQKELSEFPFLSKRSTSHVDFFH